MADFAVIRYFRCLPPLPYVQCLPDGGMILFGNCKTDILNVALSERMEFIGVLFAIKKTVVITVCPFIQGDSSS